MHYPWYKVPGTIGTMAASTGRGGAGDGLQVGAPRRTTRLRTTDSCPVSSIEAEHASGAFSKGSDDEVVPGAAADSGSNADRSFASACVLGGKVESIVALAVRSASAAFGFCGQSVVLVL